jgi:ribose 1,5-bisphosphokinase PhnN
MMKDQVTTAKFVSRAEPHAFACRWSNHGWLFASAQKSPGAAAGASVREKLKTAQ